MKSKRIHRRLILMTLAVSLVVPVFNTAVISALYTVLYSDITVPAAASDAVYFLYSMINVFTAFGVAACLSYAVVTNTHRAAVGLIAALSLPAVYFTVICVDAAFYGSSVITAGIVLYNTINCATELIRIAAVALAAWLIYRAAEKKQLPREPELLSFKSSLSQAALVSTVIVFAARLIPIIAETVMLIADVGTPQNSAEVMTLVSPYVESVIYLILGYFLTFFMIHLLDGNVRNR